MKLLTLFIGIINILNIYCWNPRLYPYNPYIHNMGNDNTFFSIHSKIAPIFTKYTDLIIYGRDLRQEVIDEDGKNKTILDIGCGTGFSTSENEGSLGLDTSSEMIEMAKVLFPNKVFEKQHIEFWQPDKHYDIVTAMFFFHEVPQFARLNIIDKLKQIAKEKIIIVDIAPNYEPSEIMSSGEPYIHDYLKHIRDDLFDFKEYILEENHVHKWIYIKSVTENINNLNDIDVDYINDEEVEYICNWLSNIIFIFSIYFA
tara:strand:+ start:38289 stop:39059 length:771 start_codon:yes stop_codon:yes gene_type:complete